MSLIDYTWAITGDVGHSNTHPGLGQPDTRHAGRETQLGFDTTR